MMPFDENQYRKMSLADGMQYLADRYAEMAELAQESARIAGIAEKTSSMKPLLTPEQQLRAIDILHNMRLENRKTYWWDHFLFGRWYISAEPLRNDAHNLLREVEFKPPVPVGARLMTDD